MLVDCDTENYGCSGGYLVKTWEFLGQTGIVSDQCYPYTAGTGQEDTCHTRCTGIGGWKPYKSSTYHTFTSTNAIKQEIYTNGPIQTAFTVYADFMSYHSGIYVHTSGKVEGGHAIKIVGWGNDAASGHDYWIVANSWGTGWGM